MDHTPALDLEGFERESFDPQAFKREGFGPHPSGDPWPTISNHRQTFLIFSGMLQLT